MWVRVCVLTLLVLMIQPKILVWPGGDDLVNQGETAYLVEKGKSLFRYYCASCHGSEGDGDGYNAEFLDKEPAELSDPEFISKKNNDQIFRVIQKGGVGVRKSALMPGFGHTLSEEEIWALVAFIRALAGDESHPAHLPDEVNVKRMEVPPISKDHVGALAKGLAENGEKSEMVSLGEKLFRKKKSCLACHRLADEGGVVGPELTRARALYKPEWLFAWIHNPQEFKPASRMPNLGLTDEEMQAIASYLFYRLQGEATAFPEEWADYLNTEGDTENGKHLFSDPEGKAYCSKCHRIKGEGGKVGPDLSFIGSSRTRPFLLESILNPKAVITSGFTTILILTKDRKFITGVKKNQDESGFDLVDKEGRELHVSMDQIKKFKTQKISTMPGNFKDLLDKQEVADLLAYLNTLIIPSVGGNSIEN